MIYKIKLCADSAVIKFYKPSRPAPASSMRKICFVLLVALLAVPTGARAEIVSNVISNSTVYQYIFINCANNDCRALFDEAVSTVSQAESEPPVASAGDSTAEGVNLVNPVNPTNSGSIVENNMPITEQTIITVALPLAESGAVVDSFDSAEASTDATAVPSAETAAVDQGVSVPTESSQAAELPATVETAPAASVVDVAPSVVERKIVISEIMSAPLIGNVEWVEIENRGGGNVDLTGWTLVEGSGKKTALFGTISPGNYLMFEKSSLNNSGDVVTLKDETGAAVNEVSYGDWNDGNLPDNAPATKSGNTAALFGEIYKETEVPTPNQENIFQLTVVEPVAVLTTSAALIPESSVTTITPSQSAEQTPTASPVMDAPAATVPPTATDETVPTFQFSDKIKISEFLADPVGADDGEWIELFNEGDVDVDLFGWSLDDAEGGSKPYKIERHVIIKADDFQLFKKEETLLVLNNSSDEVRLFDSENKLTDKAVYSSVKENHSWAWLNSEWQDSATLTPGVANQSAKSATNQEASTMAENETALQVVQFQSEGSVKVATVKKTSAAVYSLSPAEAVALPVRTKVNVTGQVVAGQNVFGKNYFYLDGAQVYWSGEAPVLAAGDLVKVTGAISESYGEKRINAKSVEVIGAADELAAEKITALPLTGDKVGKLLMIAGQVVEKKSNQWVLADANGEQIVYLKQGADIDAGVYVVGDELTVTGVLSRYNDELRLLPRGKEDIVNLTWQKNEALGLPAQAGAPALENAAVPVNQGKVKVTLALLITFVALFCVNGYWCWRHREEIMSAVKPRWLKIVGKNN